ncbi:hypothetical protein PV325_002182 [Microctonus aethiopoides]|nr:hypothetical protein PV325_002182 [Microctonus aethiopoides]
MMANMDSIEFVFALALILGVIVLATLYFQGYFDSSSHPSSRGHTRSYLMIDQDSYEELEKVKNYFTLADKQSCKVNGRID